MQYKIVPVTAFQQNSSILWCEQSNKAALIDPGGDAKLLQDTIEELGVEPEMIILTHGHLDHVGATEIMAQRYQVPVIGPGIGDEFWLNQLPMQSQMFGMPKVNPLAPSRWLEPGEIIKLGEQELEVRHCPGHTPGHMVLVHHASKLVVVGDVLFKGSIGRTDFPQGNLEQLLESIRENLLSLDDDYQFIPGHGPMSTIGQERRSNMYLKPSSDVW